MDFMSFDRNRGLQKPREAFHLTVDPAEWSLTLIRIPTGRMARVQKLCDVCICIGKNVDLCMCIHVLW